MSLELRTFASRFASSRNTKVIKIPEWDGYVRPAMEKHLARLLQDNPNGLTYFRQDFPEYLGWEDCEELRFKYCDWLCETEIWPAYYTRLQLQGKDKAIKEEAYRQETLRINPNGQKNGKTAKKDYGPPVEKTVLLTVSPKHDVKLDDFKTTIAGLTVTLKHLACIVS